MIKGIVFDNDGVLNDTVQIHVDCLNTALSEIDSKFIIYPEDREFDNIPTRKKLELLTKQRGLSIELHDSIDRRKQDLVTAKLGEIQPDERLQTIMQSLRNNGYALAVASNSRRANVYTILSNKQIVSYFDFILSNEDVINAKPHPEIFSLAVNKFDLYPHEVMVIEDHPTGVDAALKAGCPVLKNKTVNDTQLERILDAIKIFNKNNYTYGR